MLSCECIIAVNMHMLIIMFKLIFIHDPIEVPRLPAWEFNQALNAHKPRDEFPKNKTTYVRHATLTRVFLLERNSARRTHRKHFYCRRQQRAVRAWKTCVYFRLAIRTWRERLTWLLPLWFSLCFIDQLEIRFALSIKRLLAGQRISQFTPTIKRWVRSVTLFSASSSTNKV